MSAVTRFAPSPTGLLHVGNARTAILNWLFAKKAGGGMILRLDDTDAERSRDEYATAIAEDLEWLGLDWTDCVRQSDRMDRYAAARAVLEAAGRLYACYETPEELERKRAAQRERGRPPVYDRAGMVLSAEERHALEAEGRQPHWRFRLGDRPVGWSDLVRGDVRFEAGHLSDPVLFRSDGVPTYTLASVVDDRELGVTHVIRGEDHVANTAVQIDLFEALGGPVPVFAHHPLLTDASGKGLSKRLRSSGLRGLREEGIEPMAVVSLLARIGTADPVEPLVSMDEVLEGFDLDKIGRAPARFDPDDLTALNAHVLQRMPFAMVRERLGIEGADEAFWAAVSPNIAKLSDAAEWWRVCTAPLTPVIADAAVTDAAADSYPDGPIDQDVWKTWTGAVRDRTGRKGRDLFRPLRLALTAQEHGPELRALMPLIGRDRAVARLKGETA